MTSADKNSGKIHIKTLSSFKAFGSGSYRMTSVKKVKGTSDFLAMSSVDKKCSLEDYEECRRRSTFETCQCVPWELRQIQVSKRHQRYCSLMFRRDHFVLQRVESALKAIQRKHLDARSIARGCMLMSLSLKWSKTFSTRES